MRYILVFFSFFIGFIILMPKDNLFFTLQDKLKPNIYINTTIKNQPFKLNLTNSTIFVNKIDLAKIKNTDIYPFIFFNRVKINNIKLNFNNLKIDTLNITYSIINPFNIFIKGKAKFANINGKIDIKNRKIKIYLLHLKNNYLKQFLNKDKQGYFYAQKF